MNGCPDDNPDQAHHVEANKWPWCSRAQLVLEEAPGSQGKVIDPDENDGRTIDPETFVRQHPILSQLSQD